MSRAVAALGCAAPLPGFARARDRGHPLAAALAARARLAAISQLPLEGERALRSFEKEAALSAAEACERVPSPQAVSWKEKTRSVHGGLLHRGCCAGSDGRRAVPRGQASSLRAVLMRAPVARALPRDVRMETRSRPPSAVALAGAGRGHRRREQSGSIGCRCAHELTHCYRSTTCHYDRDGALRQIDSIPSGFEAGPNQDAMWRPQWLDECGWMLYHKYAG